MTNQTFSIYFRVLGIERLEDKAIHWSWYRTFEYEVKPKLYSLVLTDIRMPDMSGIEFVKKVKNMNNNIKIIFMIAFETEIDELRELSDVEPLKKPIGPETLVSLIKRLKDIEKKDDGFYTCSQCGDSGQSPETMKHRPTCPHYQRQQ